MVDELVVGVEVVRSDVCGDDDVVTGRSVVGCWEVASGYSDMRMEKVFSYHMTT